MVQAYDDEGRFQSDISATISEDALKLSTSKPELTTQKLSSSHGKGKRKRESQGSHAKTQVKGRKVLDTARFRVEDKHGYSETIYTLPNGIELRANGLINPD